VPITRIGAFQLIYDLIFSIIVETYNSYTYFIWGLSAQVDANMQRKYTLLSSFLIHQVFTQYIKIELVYKISGRIN